MTDKPLTPQDLLDYENEVLNVVDERRLIATVRQAWAERDALAKEVRALEDDARARIKELEAALREARRQERERCAAFLDKFAWTVAARRIRALLDEPEKEEK